MEKRSDIKSKDLFISFNHTFEQYNKKYRNHPDKLVKLTTKQVEDFDKEYGHYIFNKKTYSLEFEHYLLKGNKWWYVKEKDTYYQIPKAPRYLWFRNLKTSTQVAICLLGAAIIGGSIATPIILLQPNNIVSRNIEDLLPEDKKERKIIIDTVDISNTLIVIGKEFNTKVTVKQNKREDYSIKNIKVFGYRKDEKVELKLNEEYFVTYNTNNEVIGSKSADIKIIGEAIKGRIELDIQFKDSSFNNIVNFENRTEGYRSSGYTFDFSFKEGKSASDIPSSATKTYTWNKQGEQPVSQSTPFTFKEVGSYSVTLKIECPNEGYKTFEKTATLTINKSVCPFKDDIVFSNIKVPENNVTPASINTGGHDTELSETPKILYKVNDNWQETNPTTFGIYDIKADVKLKNYTDYIMNGKYEIYEVGKIYITFDVNTNGGKWSDNTTASKNSKVVKVSLEQKHFSDFKQFDGYTYQNPTKEGFTFDGWKSEDGSKTYLDTTEIDKTLTSPFTVYATFTVNTYTITDDTNPEEQTKLPTRTVPSDAIYGSEVTVTATGAAGYMPDYIQVDDSDKYYFSNGSAKFTMKYPKNISVKLFSKEEEFNVTQAAKHSEGVKANSVEIDKTSKVKISDTITVTAEAETGYTLSEIEVTGSFTTIISAFTDNKATFTGITGDATVKVLATKNEHTLTFDANVSGGTAPDAKIVEYNTKLTTATSGKSATYDDGKFRGWGLNSSDENLISDSDTMPDNDLTVYAKWNKYSFIFANPGHCTMSSMPTFTSKIALSKDDFSDLSITADNGYTFEDKFDIYYNDTKKIENFDFTSKTLAPGVNDSLKDLDNGSSFTIKPVITANDGNVKFINNGGTIKQGSTTITSLVLKTDDLILTKFKEKNITATHDYAKHSGWIIYTSSNPSGKTIDATTTMPYDGADIKPTWDTYNFEITGVNSSISGETSKTINSKIELHDQEEFTITPNEGYMFDHYEYSFTKDGEYKTITMPLRPYAISKSISSGATIYVKAVCVKCNVVTIDANGGSFTDGSKFKCINVKEGTTWKDIKDTMPKPTKDGATITKWTDGEGVELTDSTLLTDGFVVQPIWSA